MAPDRYRDGRGDVLDRPAGGARHRAVLVLGGIGVLVGLLLIGLVVFLFGLAGQTTSGAPGSPGAAAAVPPAATGGEVDVDGDVGGDARVELATRPMLKLAESAALPHALTDEVAGPPITSLAPARSATVGAGGVVVDGFPATAEGAIAQLVEVTRVGLEGGDPEGFRLAYEAVAAPGAPEVESTGLYVGLRQVRAGPGLPATGAVPGLSFTWAPTSALVKGSLDGGRYVVVCVLGEMVVGYNGQSFSSGAGACEAMRRDGDRWQIAPGAAAAAPTLAWPGTAEAVAAGYRDLTR